MDNYLKRIIVNRENGINSAIPSYCSANSMVIEAILEQGKKFGDPILIESTSNQVNQFGGYLGMTPLDFRDHVYEIADKVGFEKKQIILGGDHLGPQPWKKLTEKDAMDYSCELVKQCVWAGYTKLHLDTSMRVADDDVHEKLSNDVIAKRGVELIKVAELEYEKYKKMNPDSVHPVYVIGSEVPIPGGTQTESDEMQITTAKDFNSTVESYKRILYEAGLSNTWQNVIAVVVQPGVEFGNDEVVSYDREKAKELTKSLNEYPELVFEGHSTDYQSPIKLKQMAEDGIAILKVGPALTYAMREALFALSFIEDELISCESERSCFIDTLEKVMKESPSEWEHYYEGNELELQLSRKYSFSDRCRYYMANKEVVAAIGKLISNLDKRCIPLSLIHQFMPYQYIKVRDGIISNKPEDLIKDNISTVIDDYNYATKHNYMIRNVFIGK